VRSIVHDEHVRCIICSALSLSLDDCGTCSEDCRRAAVREIAIDEKIARDLEGDDPWELFT